MSTKYPIILAHGIILKDFLFFKAFGRIQKKLKSEGYRVFTSKTDGVGTIETNAAQLQAQIEKILEKEGVEKVNFIAYSKGGLDVRYMLDHLGMKDKVASVTFICTPHKGSPLATKIYAWPNFIKKPLAFLMNVLYRLLGDKHPNALEACRHLISSPNDLLGEFGDYEGVFMQSYSSTLKKSRDNTKRNQSAKNKSAEPSDGVVELESSKFGEYNGDCMEDSVSHMGIVGLSFNKKKNKKIDAFYLNVCRDLADRGF